jgi:TolA-binding protein
MVNARVDPTMLPGQMPPRPGMPVMPVMPGMQEQPNPFGNTGPMPPPIIILKGHDDKLKEHEGRINDVDNRVNHLNDRIDKLDYFISVQAQKGNVSMATPTSPSTPHPSVYQNANGVTFPVMPSVKEDQVSNEGEGEDQGEGDDDVMNEVFEELINNRDFITGVVDKIVNDTNLSEVIKQIEPIIVENRELRSLINSQQELLNQMSTLVFKLMSNMDTGSCVSKQCCENDAIECECNPRSYENQTQENQAQENQAQENQTHVDESAEHNEEEETPEDTDEYECRNGVCFPKQKKAVSESSNTYDPNILLQVIHQDPELSCPEDMSSNISESEI